MEVKLCRHIKTSGLQCRGAALAGSVFCYFHNRLHRSHDPYRDKLFLQPGHEPGSRYLQLPPLEDRDSIQIAISSVVNALATGCIDERRAYALFNGLYLASANARGLRLVCHPTKGVRDVYKEPWVNIPDANPDIAPPGRTCDIPDPVILSEGEVPVLSPSKETAVVLPDPAPTSPLVILSEGEAVAEGPPEIPPTSTPHPSQPSLPAAILPTLQASTQGPGNLAAPSPIKGICGYTTPAQKKPRQPKKPQIRLPGNPPIRGLSTICAVSTSMSDESTFSKEPLPARPSATSLPFQHLPSSGLTPATHAMPPTSSSRPSISVSPLSHPSTDTPTLPSPPTSRMPSSMRSIISPTAPKSIGLRRLRPTRRLLPSTTSPTRSRAACTRRASTGPRSNWHVPPNCSPTSPAGFPSTFPPQAPPSASRPETYRTRLCLYPSAVSASSNSATCSRPRVSIVMSMTVSPRFTP
jgi:hypothetical protein